MSEPELALALDGVTVRYGAHVAVRDVTVAVRRGTVHALVGENGAGKSTLMKAAVGLVPLAAGSVRAFGEPLAPPSPTAAAQRGVGMVHQHFMLVDTLTVAENVVLGVEPRWRGLPLVVDRARAIAEVAALAREHGLLVEPQRLVGQLSVGEQQRVEILKVLYRGARLPSSRPEGVASPRARGLLVLDEPTAVLSPPEVEELFAVLRRFVAAGGTIAIVTHKLDEVKALADDVTVLRRGEVVARLDAKATSPSEIARAMVGREVLGPPAAKARATGEERLALRGISTVRAGGAVGLEEVTLAVRGGEIVGVAGVEGNGQVALVEAAVGLLRPRAGRVILDGEDVTREGVRARRRRGLAHVPEDRLREGLLPSLPIEDNLLLGREARYAAGGILAVDRARLRADARRLVERFDVRARDVDRTPVGALSGGNQQKVVMARELAGEEAPPRVLVAAQPTRGVDVGAIERIHGELAALRDGGAGVLLVSAELDELLALSDRIVVLARGRLVGEMARADATRERLGRLMTGAASGASA